MSADMAKYGRKRHSLSNDGQCLSKFSLSNKMNIAGHVHLSRTGIFTRDESGLTIRPDSPFTIPVNDGSSGTNLHASATEPAKRLLEGVTKGGADKSLAAPIDKGNSPYSAHLLTDSNASSTQNAQIVISVKERVVSLDGETFASVGQGNLINPDIPSYLLQLAALILGADYTPIHNCRATQTDVKRTTIFDSLTCDASAGMLSKQEF
jgi:hypothetical protein